MGSRGEDADSKQEVFENIPDRIVRSFLPDVRDDIATSQDSQFLSESASRHEGDCFASEDARNKDWEHLAAFYIADLTDDAGNDSAGDESRRGSCASAFYVPTASDGIGTELMTDEEDCQFIGIVDNRTGKLVLMPREEVDFISHAARIPRGMKGPCPPAPPLRSLPEKEEADKQPDFVVAERSPSRVVTGKEVLRALSRGHVLPGPVNYSATQENHDTCAHEARLLPPCSAIGALPKSALYADLASAFAPQDPDMCFFPVADDWEAMVALPSTSRAYSAPPPSLKIPCGASTCTNAQPAACRESSCRFACAEASEQPSTYCPSTPSNSPSSTASKQNRRVILL